MIYELRTYTANPGKMDALLARFRDHTRHIFEKHGIRSVGYWLNTAEGRSDELWYMLAFENSAQRESAWASFRVDPEWESVREASERDGPLVSQIASQVLAPTDFSPMR